ncbi:hypothetical protein EMIT0P44_160096 [Pseudomonas sp. IT-P44]
MMSWSFIYAYWLLLLSDFCPPEHCLCRRYCCTCGQDGGGHCTSGHGGRSQGSVRKG